MNPRIVVIGAGAAGVAAATKLLELGLCNVLLLEAEARIGGRICTVPFASNVVDLGAQWCHGEKENVVFELAHKHNLLEPSMDKFYPFVCIKSNKEVVSAEVSNRLLVIANRILEDEELKKYRGSLGTFFNKKYSEALKKPENQAIDAKTANQFLEFYHKFENSVECSDSLFNVSASGYATYWNCEGDILLNWKDKGYISILRLLMKSEPNNELGVLEKRVILNKAAKQILWDNGENTKILVKCCDGDVIEADHVICTVSLGVLKERHTDLFHPCLPEQKLRAIEGLSIGTVSKIFLEFPQKFWPDEWPGFCLLWEDNDLKEAKKSNGSWIEDVFGFYTVSYQPNVLCGWIYGTNAREVEQLREDDVQRGLLLLLRKFLIWKVPDPVSLMRSSWYSNPNFRGSYSFRSMKTDELKTETSDLAAPLTKHMGDLPVLCFAGEATDNHYYSTVHGAIQSGWREAHRISEVYFKLTDFDKVMAGNVFDVLILGGGLAGLGAAYAFKDTCLKFAVLEAQDYVGGRVRTAEMISYNTSNLTAIQPMDRVDTGAQWLHGVQNEIYRLSVEDNLLSAEGSEEGLGPYIREDGYVFDEFFRKKIDFVIGSILEKCEKFLLAENKPPSVGHFLQNEFEKYLDSLEKPTDREHARQLLDWHLRFQLIDNSCLNLTDVSAKYWGCYSFNGEDCQAHINFKNGFNSVCESLVNKIGNSKIWTKKEVCDVDWDVINTENNLIIVRTADGETYYAKQVVVTFSIGVLKEQQKIFHPSLPLSMRDYINNVGFATINKIFLQFDQPWWGNMEGIQLVFKDYNYKDKPWTRYLSGFDILKPGASNTLLGWVGSYGATEMEKLNDQIIVSDCIELLRKFTSLNVPFPIKYYCSRWGANKFIRGGYSYISTECDTSGLLADVLASPITIEHLTNDKAIIENFRNLNINDIVESKKVKDEIHPLLLFAGESCHEKYFSTAHGAFHSGMTQAQLILKRL